LYNIIKNYSIKSESSITGSPPKNSFQITHIVKFKKFGDGDEKTLLVVLHEGSWSQRNHGLHLVCKQFV